MTKKLFMASAIFAVLCAFSLTANAQFGKSLKNVGKSVSKAAGSVVGDMASDMVANNVSTKIVQFMDNNNTVLQEDSEYYKRLSNLVAKNYISVDGVNLNYKIYENPEVNILATADGSIRIYTGMMDLLSDEELLAVISTQIGHIANKDVRDSLLKVASEDNAGKASSAQLEKMLSFSGDKMGTIVNELLQVPYTDDQNKAADNYAFDLLKKNGVKTDALVSALNKFAELEAAENDEEAELSAAAKFIGVNSNNATRASLISSK